ncbi:MAG: hypothetical protein JRN34_02240 [Nitrososphaerota archaeon]|nr:hypothetical protein [Nitrososphaerota archaeon]MDG6941725.1 hypothetical protein [Nitrososphaerota archaeon]MDG6951349.1 hypothetical protein [Nitrososphaerota archaeon]
MFLYILSADELRWFPINLAFATTNGTYQLALEANPAGKAPLESGSAGVTYLSYFSNPITPSLQVGQNQRLQRS